MRALGLIFIVLLFSAQLDAEDSNVPWLDDLDEARQQALADDKLILVDFWADWCMPCMQMEEFVWTDVEIGLLAGDFVPVKLDFDRQSRLAREYGVHSIPTLLFLDGFGNLMFHYRSSKSATQVAQILRAMPDGVDALHEQLALVDADPDNLEKRIRLAEIYREMRALGVSNANYREAIDSGAARHDPALEDRLRTMIALNLLELGDYVKARKALEDCLKRFPRSSLRPLHLSGLVKAYSVLDKQGKARQRLAILENDFPTHPATAEARALVTR